MMDLSMVIRTGLTVLEADEFMRWAVGENYRKISSISYFISEWNLRHGDKLSLSPSGTPREDFPKMIKLWTDFNQSHMIK